jgi:hypothetical protein
MERQQQTSNKRKVYRHLIIALVLLAIVPSFGTGSNLKDLGIKWDWTTETPGTSYNMMVYIININGQDKSGISTLQGVPKNSEVIIWLEPASRDEFDVVFPINPVTMSQDFIPEYPWGIELRENAKDPLLVLHWKMVPKAKSFDSDTPFGAIPVNNIPNRSDSSKGGKSSSLWSNLFN